MTTRILLGDCRDLLKTLPDESVHCCVTSPPYWGLRDYGHADQIGLESTPKEYVANLVAVFREVRRVLRGDGTCWVNLGSSYAASGGGAHKDWHANPGLSKSSERCGVSHDKQPSQSRSCARSCDSGGTTPQDSLGDGHACPYFDGGCQGESPPRHAGTARNGQSAPQDEQQTCKIGRDTELEDSDQEPLGFSRTDVLASTMPQSSSLPPVFSAQEDSASACQSLLETCAPDVLESAHTEPNTHGTSPILPPLVVRTQGKESFFSACGRSDCKGIGKCGLCWCSLSIPSLNIKSKDLISIPQLVAFALQADGWWLRSEITWCKKAPMPESVTDRPTSATEKVFLLAKSASYWYDAEAVKEPAAHPNKTISLGEKSFSKGQAAGKGVSPSGNGMKETYTTSASRNLWNYWLLSSDNYSGAHFATMPRKLAEICILAGCPAQTCPTCGKGWERVVERKASTSKRHTRLDCPQSHHPGQVPHRVGGFDDAESRTIGHRPACTCPPADPIPGVVLDPFGGSGTTGQVAERLGRNAILIELNPDYLSLADRRTAQGGLALGAA